MGKTVLQLSSLIVLFWAVVVVSLSQETTSSGAALKLDSTQQTL